MKLQIYRHDINSLRFFAVILVFFSHLSIAGFASGFIGVDIFFVISGFFITNLLNHKLNKKKVFNFLFRRAKRLIPNLFLTCFVIFFCSLIFLPEYLLKNLYWNFFSSIFGFANINFIGQANDYFGPSSEVNPFLHIWSLSVEKHFYIIFLIIFIFFSNYIKKFKVIFILTLSILSLLLSSDLSDIKHFYFLTPLRIFEFGIGCLVCMTSFRIIEKNQNLFSIISLIILILSMFFIEKNRGIPGWQVFFPCLATSIILITPNSRFNELISNKFLSYLGKLSYLIYLIHWPLIIFLSFHYQSTFKLKIIIFLITMILSSFIYHFYEKQLRFTKKYFQFFLITSFILVLSISYIGLFNYSIYNNNVFQNKFLADRILKHKVNESLITKIVDGRILLVGDSFSDDLYLSLENDFYEHEGRKIGKAHVDTICYNLNHKRSWLGKIRYKVGTCENQKLQLVESLNRNKPEVIILANHWKTYNYKFVLDAIKIIKPDKKTKLIIVGMRDTFNEFDQIFYRNTEIEAINVEFYKNRNKIKKINNFLKKLSKLDNVEYFPTPNPCDSNRLKCDLVDETTGEIKYLDNSHYTLGYSKKIMNEIKKILK